jgi:sugar phosphate isomerase/epimerase
MSTTSGSPEWSLGLCWGSVPGGGLLDTARVAAANGLACVTATAGDVLTAVEAFGAAGVRARLASLGVRVSGIDPLIGALPGTPAPDEVDAGRRRFFTYTEEDCCAAAEAVGAPTVNLAHYLGVPTPLTALQDAIGALAGRLHARGLTALLEFIPGSGVPNLATAVEVVSAVPHAKIMLDTWHLSNSGGTVEDVRRVPNGVIGAVQLSDRRAQEPATAPMSGRFAPGDGELPLARILAAVGLSSPGLDVCVEVFSDELRDLGWEIASRRMADGARRVLADAEEIIRNER